MTFLSIIIKIFSSKNFVEKVAAKANLDLFKNYKTLEEQIHNVIEKGKKEAGSGKIKIHFISKIGQYFITQMIYKDSEEEVLQKLIKCVMILVDFKVDDPQDDVTVIRLLVIKKD